MKLRDFAGLCLILASIGISFVVALHWISPVVIREEREDIGGRFQSDPEVAHRIERDA